MKIYLNRPIDKTLKGKIEGYKFEVGILKNGPHFKAEDKSKGFSSLAGKPIRKKTSEEDGTLDRVGWKIRNLMKIDYLREPFRNPSNKDILKMLSTFFRYAFTDNRSNIELRLRNLIQAIVRNPITRKEYGINKFKTIRVKGFSWKLVDTGQFFEAITANVRRVRF